MSLDRARNAGSPDRKIRRCNDKWQSGEKGHQVNRSLNLSSGAHCIFGYAKRTPILNERDALEGRGWKPWSGQEARLKTITHLTTSAIAQRVWMRSSKSNERSLKRHLQAEE